MAETPKVGFLMRRMVALLHNRRAFAAVFLALVTGAAWAQQAPASPPSAAASVTGEATAPATKADDELLAKTAKMYYSTRTAGLDGFDCDVHPDWRTLFSSANNGAALADDDSRLATLKPVKIALHARMAGGSTMEWNRPASPDKPLDAEATNMLDQLHQATEQTMQGFLQFWTPFVDGSVVPASSEGLKITRSATDWTLHGEQNGTEVTEIFSSANVLQHFNVLTGGLSIKFEPSYQSTEKGLLVNRFDAHIEPAGQSATPAQVMRVDVVYADIDGVPIPAKVNVDVVGTGTFNMAMNGCKTLLASK
jgi:hypothetical protein